MNSCQGMLYLPLPFSPQERVEGKPSATNLYAQLALQSLQYPLIFYVLRVACR